MSRHEKPAEPLLMGLCGLISKKLPAVGIEPTLLAERDFESRASANSATPATVPKSREIWVSGNHEFHTSA